MEVDAAVVVLIGQDNIGEALTLELHVSSNSSSYTYIGLALHSLDGVEQNIDGAGKKTALLNCRAVAALDGIAGVSFVGFQKCSRLATVANAVCE